MADDNWYTRRYLKPQDDAPAEPEPAPEQEQGEQEEEPAQ